MSPRAMRIGVSLILCVASGHAIGQSSEIVDIPVHDAAVSGADIHMVTAVYRPAGEGPFPVIVHSHGRSGSTLERNGTQASHVRSAHVRYWLAKGFAVVAPIRPGYGQTGGADREGSGVRYDVFGNCWGPPDFDRAAAAAQSAVMATLAWVARQPWADGSRVVLAGTSMGGLASVATAAANPPGVVAYLNFAGGTGGDGGRAPGRSCGSEEMESLLAAYGRVSRVPGLWLYAVNDLFWGSEWPRAWHRAFAKAGAPATFVMTEPVPGADGHSLLARGASLWIPHVDRFLDAVVFASGPVAD